MKFARMRSAITATLDPTQAQNPPSPRPMTPTSEAPPVLDGVRGAYATAGRKDLVHISYGDAAALLDVSLRTVKEWAASGALRVLALPGRVRRIALADLEAFLQRAREAS